RAVEAKQPVVRFFKKLGKRLGVHNTGSKYGTRDPRESWNPAHPFYSTVVELLPRLGSEKPNGP
ncbi:MAG TPA: hypothetical protein VK465_12300, partial [Fibrobacteria bacterium]|nr:hypothetical protein [Fibrobacteria bacterium]